MFASNAHGAGMAWNDDTGLHIYKSFDLQPILDKYKELRDKNMENVIVMHFRISTGGTHTMDNLHPFRIDENNILVHNGIIHGLPDKHGDPHSDTWYFNELCKTLPEGFQYNDTIMGLMERFVEGFNRIVFFDREDKFVIIKESDGIWENNDTETTWYSNSTYKTYEKTYNTDGYWGYTKHKNKRYKKGKNDNDWAFDTSRQLWVNRTTGQVFNEIFNEDPYESTTHTCMGCFRNDNALYSEKYGMYLCDSCHAEFEAATINPKHSKSLK
jgi:hypothetical protein